MKTHFKYEYCKLCILRLSKLVFLSILGAYIIVTNWSKLPCWMLFSRKSGTCIHIFRQTKRIKRDNLYIVIHKRNPFPKSQIIDRASYGSYEPRLFIFRFIISQYGKWQVSYFLRLTLISQPVPKWIILFDFNQFSAIIKIQCGVRVSQQTGEVNIVISVYD